MLPPRCSKTGQACPATEAAAVAAAAAAPTIYGGSQPSSDTESEDAGRSQSTKLRRTSKPVRKDGVIMVPDSDEEGDVMVEVY